MKQFRLTLAVLLTVLGTAMARADITVKVMKGGTAPHLYAYTGSGDGATKLTGDWPGTQFTDKDADGYWTMTVERANTINLIFNMNGNSQTGDITDVSGVDGVATFVYDGAGKALPTMPAGTYQAGKVAYFACPPSWDTNNLKSQIVHNGYYEEHSMTYIGIDGAGNKVYADLSFTSWGDTPQQIHFYDNAGKEAGMFTYYLGGYYTTGGLATQMTNLSSGNGYTDDNFRAGIASQLGISDGDVFAPSAITYLDVSGRGITTLAGIANFTNLQTLIASNNSLTTADLGSNANLEILNLSKNTALRGFSSNYTSSSNYINLATNNSTLKELYLADCSIGYFQAINTKYGVSSLERLDLANNTNMGGWSNGIGAQHGLKYLNVTNNGYGSDALKLTNLTQLDTLIADNNTNLGNISTISSASQLRYVSLQNCGLTNDIGFGNNPNLEYINISNNNGTAKNFTLSNNQKLRVFIANNAAIKQNGLTWTKASEALDTLIVSGNNAMQYLNSLQYASNLKYLDMSNGDLYLQSMPSFVGSNFPDLEYIDFSNDKITDAKTFSDFAALKTLKIGGNLITSNNHGIDKVTFSNCPAIETIDVSGSTKMTEVALNNQGYTNSSTLPIVTAEGCTALNALNLNNNGYTSVPDVSNIGFTVTSLHLNSNALTNIAIPDGSSVQFLYAEDNGFSGALELTAESTGSLKGLDLGNNGITSFKAEGTTLSALMIGDNPAMTTLELHGNDNLTCTTAATTMSDGSGLYVKGNTALKTIDLSNSSFNQIGADNAMLGLTAVETLNGSHNKFTTFTNSNYDVGSGTNLRRTSYVAGKSSLEDLTGLKHLDLSYNEIADSVHLYRNTLLEYLDVSHNNVLLPLATTDAEKLAMRLRKVDLLRKYHDKSTPIGISCPASTQATLDANEAITHRAFDLRDIDLRDTTGLFHLDLNYNVELKYLDISSTNIHNTAAGWWYMCPGWEYGTGGWYSTTNTSMTKSPANGSTRHHFVWLQTCGKLEEFHADDNNMQSLGVRTSPYLHTITARGMYGDCWLMRDAGTSSNPDNLTERGNISISGTVVTYSRTAYRTNDDGTLTGTVYYIDADGVEGGTNYYPNPVKWYDVSNSGYYAVRPANGVNLEHLDVSGNHLSELKVSGNTKLQHVNVENNDRLTYVDANDLPDLDTLKVADNPALEKLYADNDPKLPFIDGLDDCTALKYLHVQNNGLFGSNGFNVEANTNLQALLASRCNLPGELKVSQCAALDTLSVFDNKITTLDVSALANMHWLNCYNNQIGTLVPGTSTGMTHLDLHNNQVRDLLVGDNTAMQYFDCDNNSIRELDFHGATDIQTLHANSNNLFHIKMGSSHSSLADMQFKNNHINGIDLSGCNSAVLTNLEDENNGRTIVANGAIVGVQEGSSIVNKEMFYFQLKNVANGGYFLDNMSCDEDAGTNGREGYQGSTQGAQSLVADGFDQSKVIWAQEPFVGTHGTRSSSAEEYGLEADRVIGTIVILTESSPGSHNGTETYQYKNGLSDDSTSEFYLNWVANADNIVTMVDDLTTDGLTIEAGAGCITVTTSQATTITVVDMSGRVVTQRDVDAGTTVLDGIAAGIYVANGNKVVVK